MVVAEGLRFWDQISYPRYLALKNIVILKYDNLNRISHSVWDIAMSGSEIAVLLTPV